MKNFCVPLCALTASLMLPADLVLAQGASLPAVKTPSGWYAGGAFGSGGFKTGYERTANTIFSTGATTATVFPDAKESMWKGYVGYRLSPQISIEAGYWNFGKPSYTANISAPVTTTLQRTFRVDGFGANLVYWHPLTSTISGFGKAGAILANVEASQAVPGAGLTSLPAESERKVSWHWGLGARYTINRDFAARIEYETLHKVGSDAKFGTADIVMWTLGLDYTY